jgi:hypothetical protein
MEKTFQKKEEKEEEKEEELTLSEYTLQALKEFIEEQKKNKRD